jgi:hypothetical protein
LKGEILAHDRDVEDAGERKSTGWGDRDPSYGDRSGANGLALDLFPGDLLHLPRGPGRHPQVVIGGKDEGIGFRPGRGGEEDLHACLEEPK